MHLRKLTLLFAAALLLGMMQPAKAEEAPTSVLDTIADYEEQLEDSIANALDDDPDIDADDDDDDDIAPDRRRGRREFRDRNDRRHYGRRGPGFRQGPHGRSHDFRMGGFGFHRPGMHHASFMFGPRAWEALKLTAEQKAKVIDIMTNSYRAKLENSLQMMEARRALRGLYRDESLQAEAIVAAHSEMGAARGRMVALDRQLKADLKAVLTPEQQKAWDELQKPRPPRKPGPDGKGPGDRRPQRGPDGPAPRR